MTRLNSVNLKIFDLEPLLRQKSYLGCILWILDNFTKILVIEPMYDAYIISHKNLPEEELNEFENEFCNELIFSA